MVKTQVQLPEEDLASLRRLAAEEGVSVSELVRRGVKQVLDSRFRPSRDEVWDRALAAFGMFRSDASDVSVRHDDYLAGIYAEDLER